MPTRTLYLIRHGAADAFGTLTEAGREQCRLLGRQLAELPVDVIWHSPLSRAADSAAIIGRQLPRVLVDEAPELVDHVPHVPDPGQLWGTWTAFFDGYGPEEAEACRRTSSRLTARFATSNSPGNRATHEVLVTHAYPVAWMVREALGAPALSWLSLTRIDNTGVSVIEFADGELPSISAVNDRSHLAGAVDSSRGHS